MKEVVEHHQHAGGSRWIPLAAAVLAVFAALSGFLGNLRSTGALFAKNDAGVATTHAADAWNEYESRSIKRHIYEAALVVGGAGRPDASKIRAIVEHEKSAGAPAMAKAKAFEEEAAHLNERAERLLRAHEVLEVSTTLFEIAIVLVSITALVASSRLLAVSAATAAAVAFAILIAGALI